MRALADETGGVGGACLEVDHLAVCRDVRDLDGDSDLHADGGGGNVRHVDLRADGALTLGQLLLEIGEGGVFYHGDEVRRAKDREAAAAERGSGHILRDGFLNGKSISDFHKIVLLCNVTWRP